MLLACCLLAAKPGRSTLDTKKGYKTKTGSTSSVTLTLTCLSVCLSVCLGLSVCPSVCLSRSVCLSVSSYFSLHLRFLIFDYNTMAEQPAAEGRSLYQRVQEGIEVARGKVEELRDNLRDFDAKQQASSVAETASAYFVGSIDKAQTALADLSTTTRQWAERKTEVPVGALTGAFARVSQALNDVTDQARRYDEKYQLSSTVSAAIADPQQQASVALAAAASCAVNAANAATAQLQGVSDGLKVSSGPRPLLHPLLRLLLRHLLLVLVVVLLA